MDGGFPGSLDSLLAAGKNYQSSSTSSPMIQLTGDLQPCSWKCGQETSRISITCKLIRTAGFQASLPYSSTLAWKIPWIEGPGRLQSMGSLESDTTERLHFHFSPSCTHSSVLVWRIPGTGKPGGLPSMGLHRVGHD